MDENTKYTGIGDDSADQSSDTPSASAGSLKAVAADRGLEDLVPAEGFKARLKRAFRCHGYLGLCFLVPALLMWLVYISMEAYPFGEESVLVLDLNGQYVYYFQALRDIITDGGSFLYSFRRALGGEFLGIIGYYLASPLSIIMAIFPETMITEALLVMFLIKVGISGLTFGIYINRHSVKKNKTVTVMFSTMYALTAYAVVMQHNTMWIDNLMLLPLILMGVEDLITKKKFKMLVITLSIAVFSNFYIGYMTCIFVALYFFYYYYAHEEDVRNPEGEKNHLFRSFIRIGICAILVVTITAVMLWSSYTALRFGKTDFTNPDYGLGQKFDFLDMVSKFYFGSYDTVRPEGWPFLYSGMLSFILCPIFFFMKKISTREKIATGLFLTTMFLCFNATTIDMFWHGMQNPNWLNYRYSYMVCFLIIVLAHRVFESLEEIGHRPVVISACVISGVAFILQGMDYENLPDITGIWASVAFCAVYMLLAKGITLPKPPLKKTCITVLTIFVCFEMYAAGLANLMALDDDVVYSKRTGFRNHIDLYSPVVDHLRELDNGFYRAEKVSHRKTNDNLALNIFGLSNSTSTLNADTIKFLNYLGLASKSHWSKYQGATAPVDSLLGIKYLIGQNRVDVPGHYSELFQMDGTGENANTTLHVYQNPNAMSVAFGVSEDIIKLDLFGDDKDTPVVEDSSVVLDIDNPFERINTIYAYMLGREDTDIFVNLPQSTPTLTNLTSGSTTNHRKYSISNKSLAASISYKITAETDDDIYIYIPTTYHRNCKLTVNGVSKGTYFGNETHRFVLLGSYEPGTELNVMLELDNDYDNLYISTKDDHYFYYLDEDAYLDTVKELGGSEFEITEWTEDTLVGSINVSEGDELIFTSIPYDKGWKVIVDGKEVETFEILDALMAFRLTPGEHTLTLKYRPNCAMYGSVISVCGVVVFIGICIADHIYRRRRKAAVLPVPTLIPEDEGTDTASNTDDTATTDNITPATDEGTSEE